MARTLLVRGMLVGIVAGLIAFTFARLYGEPRVDSAIAFEESMHAPAADSAPAPATATASPAAEASPMPGMHDHGDAGEPELVSRPVQAGIGLFTGVVLYSAAFGGLFALVFAFAYGRIGPPDPRAMAVLLAVAGFVVVVLVPALKYPPNPPSVGNGETIGYRTALFMLMLVISLAAAAAAVFVKGRLSPRLGAWNARLVALGVFVAVVVAAMAILPGINEVPEHFPASLLWQFRVASLGTQILMWTTIGLLFGALTWRSLGRPA